MGKLERKLVTIISVEYDLDKVKLGEKLLIQHDKNNQYDKKALEVILNETKIGFVAASPHTIQKDCVSNSDIFLHIPSKTVPLVGTVVKKTDMQFKNGDIVTCLIASVNIVNQQAS